MLKCFFSLSPYFKRKTLSHKLFHSGSARTIQRTVNRNHGNRNMTSTVTMATGEWITNSLNESLTSHKGRCIYQMKPLYAVWNDFQYAAGSLHLSEVQSASPEFCLKQSQIYCSLRFRDHVWNPYKPNVYTLFYYSLYTSGKAWADGW